MVMWRVVEPVVASPFWELLALLRREPGMGRLLCGLRGWPRSGEIVGAESGGVGEAGMCGVGGADEGVEAGGRWVGFWCGV